MQMPQRSTRIQLSRRLRSDSSGDGERPARRLRAHVKMISSWFLALLVADLLRQDTRAPSYLSAPTCHDHLLEHTPPPRERRRPRQMVSGPERQRPPDGGQRADAGLAVLVERRDANPWLERQVLCCAHQ